MRMDKSRKWLSLITLLFLVVGLPHSANAEDPDAILSPNDTAQMFQMTESQWVENLKMLKANGMGDYQRAPSGEYTMYVRPPPGVGVLVVTPSYRTGAPTPWKLSVTTIYDTSELAKRFNEMPPVRVEELVKKAWRDMQPNFSVMGYLVRNKDEPPAIHFTIFRKGDFPTIDAITKMGQVCPTSDGKKTCIRATMLMH